MLQNRPSVSIRTLRLTAAGAAVALTATALAACQVGPRLPWPGGASATAGYAAGGLPTAIAADQRLQPGADVPARWWEVYGSPELNALMDQAIKASPDIASAEGALRSAHELYLAQHGALLPSVDAGYNFTRQKFSDEISPPQLNSTANPYSLHTLQLTVGYTPDVFGVACTAQAESALAQDRGAALPGRGRLPDTDRERGGGGHPAGLADRPDQGRRGPWSPRTARPWTPCAARCRPVRRPPPTWPRRR